MYMISPSVYQKLLHCLDDIERKEISDLNKSDTMPEPMLQEDGGNPQTFPPQPPVASVPETMDIEDMPLAQRFPRKNQMQPENISIMSDIEDMPLAQRFPRKNQLDIEDMPLAKRFPRKPRMTFKTPLPSNTFPSEEEDEEDMPLAQRFPRKMVIQKPRLRVSYPEQVPEMLDIEDVPLRQRFPKKTAKLSTPLHQPCPEGEPQCPPLTMLKPKRGYISTKYGAVSELKPIKPSKHVQCDICGKSLYNNWGLKRHKQTVHGELGSTYEATPPTQAAVIRNPMKRSSLQATLPQGSRIPFKQTIFEQGIKRKSDEARLADVRPYKRPNFQAWDE